MKNFTCPVCGFDGLNEEPKGSYEICLCCSVQFGYEDAAFAAGSKELAHRCLQLRACWLHHGAQWFSRWRRPPRWDPIVQLESAGLHVPSAAEIEALRAELTPEAREVLLSPTPPPPKKKRRSARKKIAPAQRRRRKP